ncbi:MAG: 16S rRNA (uracil1498-N3)-methyltransferase [Pseudohongiellaceae bacterium]|jgi:16S rRNA (uracil1498-N3)-methyltransferase
MPIPPRCLVPDVDAPQLIVDKAGVHHFERVLRMAPGDPIELVDGRGGLAKGRWGRKGLLTQVQRAPRTAPPAAPFILAVAPPRPTRLDWLVEKAAELGVTRLQLLKTQHSGRDVVDSRIDKLRRKTAEAMLQCRRLHQMDITKAVSLADVLSRWSSAAPWLASPGTVRGPNLDDNTQALLGLVGPEGGWHEDELRLASEAGAQTVSLGSGVLRVETAAISLAVLAAQRGLARPGSSPWPPGR